MRITVLGPIEAIGGNGALHLPRRQGRLALGILALAANEVVSADRLIDLIWGERPPATVRAVLQSRLSDLRTMLAEADIDLRTVSGGYRLSVDPDDVDAHRFQRLVAEARSHSEPAVAVVKLRDALGLWRGPALNGWLSAEAHRSVCHRLDVARLSAHELLFEHELALGRHVLVAEEIPPLVGVDLGQERLTELLMVAQHRCGRTADALRSFEQCRRWLADELGIAPGPALRGLHVALLRNEDAIVEPSLSDIRVEARRADADRGHGPAVPNTLPADARDFLGREAVTAELLRLLGSGGNGVRTVVVTGPAGVGKTALSVHVAHLVRRTFPDGQLFADLRGADRQPPPTAFELVGRFLRALGMDGALPDSVDGRVDLYRQLLSGRRVMVVLDNAASAEQVQPLVPGSDTCAVLINSRARIGAYLGADIVELSALGEPEAVGLLTRIAGPDRVRADPTAAERLVSLCGGLPLALRIVAARLAAKPHWTLARLEAQLSDEHRRLDQLTYENISVRSSIGFSYADLRPEAQRLLRLLGDIDYPDVAVWSAAALLDTDLTEAEGVLEQLHDARLIDIAGVGSRGHIRYRLHDLVRIFAAERAREDEDPQDLAAARDRCLGAWLAWAEQIQRQLIGGPFLNVRSTAPRWPAEIGDLGGPTGDLLQWFEAERFQIIHLIRLAADDLRSRQCWDLAVTSGSLLEMGGYYDDWLVVLDLAMACCVAAADDLGRAAILIALGMHSWNIGAQDLSRERFREARAVFDSLGHQYGCASTSAHIGMLDRLVGRPEQALAGLTATIPALETADDPVALVFVHRNIGLALIDLGDLDTAQWHLNEAMAIGRASRLTRALAQARASIVQLRLRQQRYTEAEQLILESLNDARMFHDRGGEVSTLYWLGQCHQAAGHTQAAYRAYDQAMSLIVQPHHTTMAQRIRTALDQLAGNQ